ncbi:5704_t:CDS:1, partial [Funneliformis geosporum]
RTPRVGSIKNREPNLAIENICGTRCGWNFSKSRFAIGVRVLLP